MSKQITIEEKTEYPGGPSYFSVYEFGVYPRSSVLAGQTRKSGIACYETLEEAKEDYPMADFAFIEANNTFGHLPGSDELDGQGGVWGV